MLIKPDIGLVDLISEDAQLFVYYEAVPCGNWFLKHSGRKLRTIHGFCLYWYIYLEIYHATHSTFPLPISLPFSCIGDVVCRSVVSSYIGSDCSAAASAWLNKWPQDIFCCWWPCWCSQPQLAMHSMRKVQNLVWFAAVCSVPMDDSIQHAA